MKIDEVLDRINEARKVRGEKIIAFDSLSTEERNDVFAIAKASEAKELSIEDLKTHITAMRRVVESKLTDDTMEMFSLWSFLFNWKQDYYLKARLRNYILLEEMLFSPEAIRKRAEQQISSIGVK